MVFIVVLFQQVLERKVFGRLHVAIFVLLVVVRIEECRCSTGGLVLRVLGPGNLLLGFGPCGILWFTINGIFAVRIETTRRRIVSSPLIMMRTPAVRVGLYSFGLILSGLGGNLLPGGILGCRVPLMIYPCQKFS